APGGARVPSFPRSLSLFGWLALGAGPAEIRAAFFDIGPFARGAPDPRPPERYSEILSSLSDFYPPPARAVLLRFAKPPETPLLASARALPDVQTYLAFARFPFVTMDPVPGGGASVALEDLRFLPSFSGPWERDPKGGLRRQPFVYRVKLDSAGRPLERTWVVGPRFSVQR